MLDETLSLGRVFSGIEYFNELKTFISSKIETSTEELDSIKKERKILENRIWEFCQYIGKIRSLRDIAKVAKTKNRESISNFIL